MATRQKYSTFDLRQGEEVNEAISQMPVAQEQDVFIAGGLQKVFSHKAIVVDDKVIDIPTKNYKLVQHSEAFRPVVEGITLAGVKDFTFSAYSTNKVGYLNLYIGSINDGTSHINVGMQISNSLNRTLSVKYGFKFNEREAHIEIVGYRQVCSNGLKIRVPLEQAEIIRPELREQIKNLLTEKYTFKHVGNVKVKILDMQYVSEAFSLLVEPLELYIKKAKSIDINVSSVIIDSVKSIIRKHVSERMTKKILEQFSENAGIEGTSLWGLFNAITYIASHNSTVSGKTYLENVGAEILNEVMFR